MTLGAVTCQPRASPWVCEWQPREALKGRNNPSIPTIPSIKLETMPTQERTKLLLERHCPMMFFLCLDVPSHMFYL